VVPVQRGSSSEGFQFRAVPV